MPRGGFREGAGAKPSWSHGKTKVIRVPEALAEQLLQIAKALDTGESLINITESNNNSEQATLPHDNKYKDYLKRDGTYEWKTLLFRSPAELDIAIAFENRGILFFANSRCRIQDRLGTPETKEVDFLVCHKGKVRILEIDGREFHQQSSLDYARDRLFEKNGIRTTRYTASECMSNPDAVVEEYLELFDF